ncbi:glycoside hydrolase family 61 protein [Tricladium varicosporioides]|nr:glycoside hydrolase family 61 protein [Hymenoscyphus varicosporioides]
MLCALLLATAGLLHAVAGHGGVSNYTVGGTWYRGYNPSDPAEWQDGQPWLINRKWTSINPIGDPMDPAIACNTPGTPAVSSIPIRAGENITAVYYYWLHNVGPMITWMASCNGPCSQTKPNSLSWFKIAERGHISGTIVEGWWFQRDFQDWTGKPCNWTETIPKSLKSGEYLIRHEIIALHIPNSPQFYPECAHLVVSGHGTKMPSKKYLGSFPGIWSMNDTQININIYSDENKNKTSYPIPGPPVWTG